MRKSLMFRALLVDFGRWHADCFRGFARGTMLVSVPATFKISIDIILEKEHHHESSFQIAAWASRYLGFIFGSFEPWSTCRVQQCVIG
jgi:hypothetical protein